MAPKKRTTQGKGNTPSNMMEGARSAPAQAQSASSLPLQHYVPRVALQLAAVTFCLYATSTVISPKTSTQASAGIVGALVQDPVRFLATANASLLAVQVWYGLWTRSHYLAHSQKQVDGLDATSTSQPQQPPAPKKGFKGTMKAIVDRAWKGELPHHHALKAAREAHLAGKLNFGLDVRF